jgi:hypothetical protein
MIRDWQYGVIISVVQKVIQFLRICIAIQIRSKEANLIIFLLRITDTEGTA